MSEQEWMYVERPAMGIDPSTTTLGWAITTKSRVLDAGLITSKGATLDMRFLELDDALSPILDRAREMGVICVGLEQYMSSYPWATDAVKGIIGIIRLAIIRRDMEVLCLHPMQVKKRTAGTGRAQKEDVARCVAERYGLLPPEYADDNITDAIAGAMSVHNQIDEWKGHMAEVMAYIENSDGRTGIKHLTMMPSIRKARGGIKDSKRKKGMMRIRAEARELLCVLRMCFSHSTYQEEVIFDIPWLPLAAIPERRGMHDQVYGRHQ